MDWLSYTEELGKLGKKKYTENPTHYKTKPNTNKQTKQTERILVHSYKNMITQP